MHTQSWPAPFRDSAAPTIPCREKRVRRSTQAAVAVFARWRETIGGSTIVRRRTHAIHHFVGRLRSTPLTRKMPSFHQGRPPRNKGRRYPADPPNVEEIIAVMHAAGGDHDAIRLRGLIVVLWRAGLRISEALALARSGLDLHRDPGAPRQRRQTPRGRHGPLGLGAADAMATTAHDAARRRAGLRAARTDRRPTMGARRRPLTTPPSRGSSWCAAAVCASPAPAHSRR